MCSDPTNDHRFAQEDGVHEIELEFLGKDSMLFKQTIDFSTYGANGVQVFKNLRQFVQKKQPSQDVFDLLTVSEWDREVACDLPYILHHYVTHVFCPSASPFYPPSPPSLTPT